ncbi:MAG: hypothetical protein ACRETU_01405 [Steroidobacterales bacterium]
MLVCPLDMHACLRRECTAGCCELTGEMPFIPCSDCGTIVVRPVAREFCIECVAVYAAPQKG